jgi:hypothetical protein
MQNQGFDYRHERRERRQRMTQHDLNVELVCAVEDLSDNLGKYGSLIAAALGVIASPANADPGALQALADRLKASGDKLGAAIKANLPADQSQPE